MSGVRIGEVTHFYDKISVAVIALADTIKIGDTVHFLGTGTDFRQQIDSLQIEHEPVGEGAAGQEVAMKVNQKVRPHAAVFRITTDEE